MRLHAIKPGEDYRIGKDPAVRVRVTATDKVIRGSRRVSVRYTDPASGRDVEADLPAGRILEAWIDHENREQFTENVETARSLCRQPTMTDLHPDGVRLLATREDLVKILARTDTAQIRFAAGQARGSVVVTQANARHVIRALTGPDL